MIERVIDCVARLAANPAAYGAAPVPHPRASALALPDGRPAHEALRVWAAFDERYPWHLTPRRSTQRIASRKGIVTAKPMKRVLLRVCYESIADELEGDEEAIAYAKGLAGDFADEMPGYGVILEPEDQPDRVLWMPPDAEPSVVWYEDDAFARREPFHAWLERLFEG